MTRAPIRVKMFTRQRCVVGNAVAEACGPGGSIRQLDCRFSTGKLRLELSFEALRGCGAPLEALMAGLIAIRSYGVLCL